MGFGLKSSEWLYLTGANDIFSIFLANTTIPLALN